MKSLSYYVNVLFILITCIMYSQKPINIAEGKRATQFSVYPQECPTALKAVDGSSNGYWEWGSVSVSAEGSPGQILWWMVDLGRSFNFESIEIYKRQDPCCGDRFDNWTVFTSDRDYRYVDFNSQVYYGKKFVRRINIPRPSTAGSNPKQRYVYVALKVNASATNNFLELAEVKVLYNCNGFSNYRGLNTETQEAKGNKNINRIKLASGTIFMQTGCTQWKIYDPNRPNLVRFVEEVYRDDSTITFYYERFAIRMDLKNKTAHSQINSGVLDGPIESLLSYIVK